MLDVARQNAFIRIAASTTGLTPRQIARQVGFAPDYGKRLYARHAAEIEQRRAKIARLEGWQGRRPKYKPGTGEQLRLLETGADPHLVDPAFAERWWRQRLADFADTEIRHRDPSEMDRLRVERILTAARAKLHAATKNVVKVFEVHGQPLPDDLVRHPERERGGRAEGTTLSEAAAVDAAVDAAGGVGVADHLADLRPQRCPRCCLVMEDEPQYGLVPGGRGIGVIGVKRTCGCTPDSTAYSTERSRALAFSWIFSLDTLARTGDGNSPSPYAARTYPDWY